VTGRNVAAEGWSVQSLLRRYGPTDRFAISDIALSRSKAGDLTLACQADASPRCDRRLPDEDPCVGDLVPLTDHARKGRTPFCKPMRTATDQDDHLACNAGAPLATRTRGPSHWQHRHVARQTVQARCAPFSNWCPGSSWFHTPRASAAVNKPVKRRPNAAPTPH
jgi:hypothetical protein